MKNALIVATTIAAALATAPAGAAVISETQGFSTLDHDGNGRMRFAAFDDALGTLTGATFTISGTFVDFPLILLRDFDLVPGVLTLETVFFANIYGAAGPHLSTTQSFAYDAATFPVHVQMDFSESVLLPQLPDVPLDALTLAANPGGRGIEADYNAGTLFGLSLLHDSAPAISGHAVMTYAYAPVPEPVSLTLLGVGLGVLGAARMLHRSKMHDSA